MKEVDYQEFCPQGTPLDERNKFAVGDIFENAAICLKCEEYIRSKNRRDFRYCSCESVAVDGGSEYARRVGNREDYVDCITPYKGSY